MKQLISGCVCAAVAVICVATASAQKGAAGGEWPYYSGDLGSTKYSPLDQINKDNVEDLVPVWKWDSPDNEIAAANPSKMYFGYKGSPLVVDGVMYTVTGYNLAASIDLKTGKTLWTFDPKVWEGPRPGNLGFNSRGVSFWKDENGKGRVILCTQHNYMYALDAATGNLIESFGDKGVVDLDKDYRREVLRTAVWAVSPSIVVKDTIVVGRAINDGPTTKEMPPGDVLAYDARTGAHKWTFFNPPKKGQVGYETWEDGSAEYTGNANVWTHMSADPELGYVYLPFGTPTNDWYGGHRHGDNAFAESIVCVKADTGEYVWHFQHVHHGLWDYDLPSAPVLCDITVDGKEIKALAQITKQGFCWVLDRTTGKGVWPIEERPVPQSTAEGEKSSPTQPFPTKPAPFVLQGGTEENLIDYTPELKAEALKILNTVLHGPIYTPPVEGKPTINLPGWGGGGNWPGASFDPDTDMLYIPSNSGAPITMTLVRPDAARSNFTFVGQVGNLAGPKGLPLFKGPYGKVSAIDLKTGEYAWEIAIGRGPADHPALKDLNLPDLGSDGGNTLLTKTLLFITNSSGGGGRRGGGDAAANTAFNFRAIDKATGKVIHGRTLDVSPSAPHITYMLEGKQYIAIPFGGGRSPSGIMALALP